jgi:hypothetical protein
MVIQLLKPYRLQSVLRKLDLVECKTFLGVCKSDGVLYPVRLYVQVPELCLEDSK